MTDNSAGPVTRREPVEDIVYRHPLNVIMRSAMHGARGDLVLVALRVDDERLVIQGGLGPLAEQMVGNLMLIRDSVAAPVFRDGTPLLVPDYPDRGGAEPGIRVQIGSVIVVPLQSGARIEGALAVGRLSGRTTFRATDLDQLTAFVGRAGLARELAGAHGERRAARMAEDLSRIRDDLHDQVIQELFAVGMALQAATKQLDDSTTRELIMTQVDALDMTTRRIRGLISDLPADATDGPPLPLPKRLVAIVDSLTPALQCLPTVSLTGPVEATVSPELAGDVEAVLREALSNIAKHAAATSVQIRVAVTDTTLTLDVVDDGRGITDVGRSSGLANIRRRAARHRGRLELFTPSGGGTHVRWTVPVQR